MRHSSFVWLTGAVLGAAALASSLAEARHGELPNRLPEPAPFNVAEAKGVPPPYSPYFADAGSPHTCASCHRQIFDEWNGSMMSNSWRDPAWRAAFLLIARLTSTDGGCDIPDPPDGTQKSRINPFANDDCSSTFDLGTSRHTTQGSGSLLDDFCSRCHMPSSYIDHVLLEDVVVDDASGVEHAPIDPAFDPTSDLDTGIAFANAERQGTEPEKLGLTCTFCHTLAETRYTPFHNYDKAGTEYHAAAGKRSRAEQLRERAEMFDPPAPDSRNLGYAIGAGSFRLSPQALAYPERFGPLTHSKATTDLDAYLSGVFQQDISFQSSTFEGSTHRGNRHALFERGEMCGTCHDVTNPLTIKNTLGRWVGGFPIERTYSEWASSRYADRPGNRHYDARFKRDCQTCHMQQHFGQAGTAQSLYDVGNAVSPLHGTLATTGPERPLIFSHHFVGGNAYVTRLIGADSDAQGQAEPYPKLSAASFSSADPKSPYYNAYWVGASESGPPTHHARFAWDRLRNAVEVSLDVSGRAAPGTNAALRIRVVNSGTGHDFPTGFPEGRNAWVAVRAFDVGTGKEIYIVDSHWKRRSRGVGYLTRHDQLDPNFPKCKWKLPAGSPDPYAWQFRAVASLGDGCPTLDLPYATPLNLVVNEQGLPVDERGSVIGPANPLGKPQFRDLDGDGDRFDDSFLIDTRLRPLPHQEARIDLDRYAVAIPSDAIGPISVTAAVYYQSLEAIVAKKFLGNLADTDQDHVLEPCVLDGPCDGRTPNVEPAVVEGAPPVPISVQSTIINLSGRTDRRAPQVAVYPTPGQRDVHRDAVIKISASEPIADLDAERFQLMTADKKPVPAHVAQIADFTWALFPDAVFLNPGETYVVAVEGAICDLNHNCAEGDVSWKFAVALKDELAAGDTRPPNALVHPMGFAESVNAGVLPTPGRRSVTWLLGIVFTLGVAGACGWLVSRLRRARSQRPIRLGSS